MIAAVDTNILIDVIGDFTNLHESATLLEKYSSEGRLIMSPVAYSEFLASFLKGFDEKEAVNLAESFLTDFSIEITPFTNDDFLLTAKVWQLFSSRTHIFCPKCGSANIFKCKKCNAEVSWRNHVITDFLIGAHAQNHADVLLTRDRAYYRKYFKMKVLP